MDSEEKLLKWLDIESNVVNTHGRYLWEEMKFFSWTMNILLSATPILKIKYNYNSESLIVIPILAIVMAIIAILIIKKENKNYLGHLGTVLRIEQWLGFHAESNGTPIFISKYRKNFLIDTIDNFIDKDIKLLQYKVRSIFIFYFIVLLLIGCGEMIWIIF